MIEQDILNGSFKGIQFSIDSGSISGGRKVSIKQFPNRDTQSVEDLGLRPRRYSLTIVVNSKPQQDYFQYRNSLLSALESKTTGDLIHPFYGRIQNVKAVSYNINERITEFGFATVAVEFEVDDNTGIPTASGNAITEVVQLNNTLQSNIEQNIGEEFTVTNSFTGNFSSAENKINEIIEFSANAVQYILQGDNKNLFNAFVNQFSDDVIRLIGVPEELGQQTIALIRLVGDAVFDIDDTYKTLTGETDNNAARISVEQTQSVIGGIVASNGSGLNALNGFFTFGQDDVDINDNTEGKTERKKNQELLNDSVQTSAFGHAMQLAAQGEYQTTQQIEDVENLLGEQFTVVQNSSVSQDVKDSTSDLYLRMLDVLNQNRSNAFDTTTLNVTRTTTRLLSFELYGSDQNGTALGDLNNVTDPSFVSGDLEVFTGEA